MQRLYIDLDIRVAASIASRQQPSQVATGSLRYLLLLNLLKQSHFSSSFAVWIFNVEPRALISHTTESATSESLKLEAAPTVYLWRCLDHKIKHVKAE